MQKKRIGYLLAATLALIANGQTALCGTETGLSLLEKLRHQLDSARALPKGSKAAHPEQDLAPLIGVSSSEVEHTLGLPKLLRRERILVGQRVRLRWSVTVAILVGPDFGRT